MTEHFKQMAATASLQQAQAFALSLHPALKSIRLARGEHLRERYYRTQAYKIISEVKSGVKFEPTMRRSRPLTHPYLAVCLERLHRHALKAGVAEPVLDALAAFHLT